MSRLVAEELILAAEHLTGASLQGAVSFPEETLQLGFDHLDGTNTVTADLLAAQDRLAGVAADAWLDRVRGPEVVRTPVWSWGGEGCTMEDQDGTGRLWWPAISSDGLSTRVTVPSDGTYRVTWDYFYRVGLDEHDGLTVSVRWDGDEIWQGLLDGPVTPAKLDMQVTTMAGEHELSFVVLDGVPDGTIRRSEYIYCLYEDVIGLSDVVLHGPRAADAPTCDAQQPDCVRAWLQGMATRAWRRPPSEASLDRLVALTDRTLAEGASLDRAAAVALHSLLLSPWFVFVVEEEGALDDWALATRLARVLWSSVPDEALLACARDGMTGPCGLRAQTDRMLADPKADGFVRRFLEAWLGLRDVAGARRSAEAFPTFDDAHPHLVGETAAVFSEFLTTDRPMTGLVDAPLTWLTPELAAH
jgi:hypothetical protein